ncbi:DDT domain-containing protein PTM [Trifolium repens]|nr:DDT domain-containing protein PTM [Trifolium repens]
MRYVIEIRSDNMVISLGASLVTSSPNCETCSNAITKESPNGNIKLHKETMTNSVVLIVNYQSAMCCPKRDSKTIPTKCFLVSNQFINYGDATNKRLPMRICLCKLKAT